MHPKGGWVLAYSLAAALSSSGLCSSLTKRQSSLQWQDCGSPTPTNARKTVCTTLQVPLDWANPGTGSVTLAIAKIEATSSRQGTIFVTSGGVGMSGVRTLQGDTGRQIFNVTGGSFDVVSWDARGSGSSTPSINCFPDPASQEEQQSLTLTDRLAYTALEANLTGPVQSDIDRFLNNINSAEANIQELVRGCTQRYGNTLQYLGAAASTRDLVALADAVQGNGSSILYWGLSYGTVIGASLLKMFPDRVDKIVLDGVVDYNNYVNLHPFQEYANTIQDAEAALKPFYDACAKEGPSTGENDQGCALAFQGSTAQDIEREVQQLIIRGYEAGARNLSLPGGSPATSILIRSQLTFPAVDPFNWVRQATLLKWIQDGFQELFTSNSTTSSTKNRRAFQPELTTSLMAKRQDGQTINNIIDRQTSAATAIRCGDAPEHGDVKTQDMFAETVRLSRNESLTFGPLLPVYISSYCHLWPVRAVERNVAASAAKFAGRVLIIGNTLDPATPFSNAVNLANQLNAKEAGKAVLVRHDVSGHTSLELRSLCTESIIWHYFSAGHLPDTDTVCGTNSAGFPPTTGSDGFVSSTTSSAPFVRPTASGTTASSAVRSNSVPVSGTLTLIALGVMALFVV